MNATIPTVTKRISRGINWPSDPMLAAKQASRPVEVLVEVAVILLRWAVRGVKSTRDSEVHPGSSTKSAAVSRLGRASELKGGRDGLLTGRSRDAGDGADRRSGLGILSRRHSCEPSAPPCPDHGKILLTSLQGTLVLLRATPCIVTQSLSTQIGYPQRQLNWCDFVAA